MLVHAKDIKKSNTGEHIAMGGLVLQLVSFGFFTAVAARFHSKMKRSQRRPGSMVDDRVREWRPLLFCLYGSCILIMIRMYHLLSHSPFILVIIGSASSVYRVVEFSQGFDGYLASHEVYFYVLEAVRMMPPFILFNVFHPGRVVKGGFVKCNTDVRQPGVLLEGGLKNGGDETDSSGGKL
jgi:hypothetical protein